MAVAKWSPTPRDGSLRRVELPWIGCSGSESAMAKSQHATPTPRPPTPTHPATLGQVVNSALVGGEQRDGEKRADGVRMYMSSYGSLVLNQVLQDPPAPTAKLTNEEAKEKATEEEKDEAKVKDEAKDKKTTDEGKGKANGDAPASPPPPAAANPKQPPATPVGAPQKSPSTGPVTASKPPSTESSARPTLSTAAGKKRQSERLAPPLQAPKPAAPPPVVPTVEAPASPLPPPPLPTKPATKPANKPATKPAAALRQVVASPIKPRLGSSFVPVARRPVSQAQRACPKPGKAVEQAAATHQELDRILQEGGGPAAPTTTTRACMRTLPVLYEERELPRASVL